MADWVTAVVAGFALIVAILSAAYSRRSANAAEDARDQAKKVADSEVARDHRAHMPPETGSFRTADGQLYYEFQLPDRYAMKATVTARGGTVWNDSNPVMRTADKMWRVHITDWVGSSHSSQWDLLSIRFWPPQSETNQPDPWVCLCGRDPAPDDGPGHWRWDVGVPRSRADVPE